MVKTQPFRGMLGRQKNEARRPLFHRVEGESGLGEEGAGPVSDMAWLWPFLSFAEACPAPPAGCPEPSRSADVVHQGNPQGARCAMTVAGVSAGSASVK